MPRAKTRVASRNRRKQVLKAAKGYWGRRSKLIECALDAIKNAGQYAYRDRRVKKRKFRELWIIRINAAARMYGMTYSTLIHKMNEKNIILDRKVLADMAVRDISAFAKLVDSVK